MLAVGAAGAITVYAGSDQFGKGFITLWMVGLTTQTWWVNFRMPQKIETSDAGLRFVARRRVVDVPWSALRSVASPWHDFGNQSLVWKWEGRTIRTFGGFVGLHRLLGLVEKRAPHAKVWV
jgi:hypothetical protein